MVAGTAVAGAAKTDPAASVDHLGLPVARSTPLTTVRSGGRVCGTPVDEK
jgi:hypothetical protein